MPPGRPNLIDIWNQANPEVGPQILAWRAEGVTYEEIAYRLRGLNITVTQATVRRWCLANVPENPAASVTPEAS